MSTVNSSSFRVTFLNNEYQASCEGMSPGAANERYAGFRYRINALNPFVLFSIQPRVDDAHASGHRCRTAEK
ncbi:hypothetical protein RA210_U280025 [Rubrivivax sp. A210]|nr:hypothetical protein RA210_U280025 [Rubrivivax sp. A210]